MLTYFLLTLVAFIGLLIGCGLVAEIDALWGDTPNPGPLRHIQE